MKQVQPQVWKSLTRTSTVIMGLRSWLLLAVTLLVMISLLLLRTAGGQTFTTESQRRWQIQNHQPLISNWQLQDHQGGYFALDDLGERGVLIDFIYTRCPTICRAAGSRYAQIQQKTREWSQPPLLLSISIDPEYDTPQRLLRYRQRYTQDKNGWLVARPVDGQTLLTIKRETGIKVIPDGLGGYAHTDSFHWARPDRLLQVFDWNDADITQRLRNVHETTYQF